MARLCTVGEGGAGRRAEEPGAQDGGGEVPFVFPLFFLGALLSFSRDRPGRRAKGCLHGAALRGLRRGIGICNLVMI